MKMKHLNKIILGLVLLTISSLKAQQDIHLSQYFVSPILFNPASAGAMAGDLRVMAHYRNQWANVADPYKTIAAAVDMPFMTKMKSGKMGFGIDFYKDDAGDSKMATLNANFSLSYHLDLTGNSNNFLSIGVKGGLIQRTISGANLYWDEQWNGTTFNQNIGTVDQLGITAVSAMDFGSGLYWHNAPKPGTEYFAGFSVMHFTSPNVSMTGTSEALLKKYTFNAGAEIPLKNENMAILPGYILAIQGPNQYMNLGGEFKYILKDKSHFTNYSNGIWMTMGGFVRFGDAAFVVSRFSWQNFIIGASYDFNVSQLSTAISGVGGLELSLGYKASLDKGVRAHSVRFK